MQTSWLFTLHKNSVAAFSGLKKEFRKTFMALEVGRGDAGKNRGRRNMQLC